jgi:SAM-dependent methyltransferase
MDLFSKQAQDYAQFRPQYPAELYRFLMLNCRHHDYAWDVATGNGQAAVELSKGFGRVLATDLSGEQIALARKAPNLEYRIANASEALIEERDCIDLITVATGLHWFERDSFFKEVTRVLKPGGLFAAWAYGFHSKITSEIDQILHSFYFETLKGFWKPNNQLVWNGYKSIELPYEKITVPRIQMDVNWKLDQFIGYCGTWSAVQLFKDAREIDPTLELKNKLAPLWGEGYRNLSWKLGLIACRKPLD